MNGETGNARYTLDESCDKSESQRSAYRDREHVNAACDKAMLKLHVDRDWAAQICEIGRGAKHLARVSRMGT
jgi:hypothetical protein